MPETPQQRRERCRHDVLAFLALRDRLAHRVQAIRERINRDYSCDYAEEEIRSAM